MLPGLPHPGRPPLAGLDPEACHFSWEIILTTNRDENAIRDVFIFVEEGSSLEVSRLADTTMEEGERGRMLGEILVQKGDLTPERLSEVLSRKPLLGEMLVREKAVEQSKIEAALAEQRHLRKIGQAQQEAAASVRVPAEKLDTLVDLVGELVIVQARLSQHAAGLDPTAVSIAEEVERLTAELRDNTMSLRMVQIGTMFGRFKRLVRDLSKELGKEIELSVAGGETELDKTVIEKLNDPLIHLIRNSIDHGIEPPEERKAAGKGPTGTIRLVAVHAGANVVITIADDGAGLDVGKIKAKAAEKGLLPAQAEMTDQEAFKLIFEPGFSTADRVSDISGRGVGMDVVRRGVESLRGAIEVASRPGEGTSIAITLPLTMAIIDGMLVETGGEKYVIPQAAIVECFALTQEEIAQAHGKQVIEVRGHMLPYICLRERFGIGGEVPPSRRVVLCEEGGRNIGLAVDRVLGNYQTVIKPLGEVYRQVECVSGATILGDGTVALILDPSKMYEEMRRRQEGS
ncbi:MAG: chemotaxis protein CheA [Desulfobacteraceae bacterium]|nr:chemotaxis protein CheA [Desulfobacteraceae bacterium]